MEGWDLQAVVRGCTNNIDAVRITNTMECSQAPSSSCFALSNIQEDHYLFHAFDPQLFEATTTALDELEDLYKPFYPVFQYPISSPPTSLTSSISLPKEFTEVAPKKLKNMKESSPMCKKSSRKSQNKRVVKEVKAEELFSDVWAWRKYGQKPIKGSPYPRSYYRCSSSKGCSARKQVERSCSNPETFVITYTAEHNHVHPTRRNSLAGSTRSKFPTAPKTKDEPCLNSPAIVPLVASIADESSHEIIKEEAKLLEEDENVMLDMMLSDNTNFPNLDELDACELSSSELPVMDGWFLDQFSDNFPSPWFNIGHSTSTVTGAC